MTNGKPKTVMVELLEGKPVCVDESGQQEMLVEIDLEELTKFLQWVQRIHETLAKAGMAGTAEALRDRVGRLVVNRRLVWDLPGGD